MNRKQLISMGLYVLMGILLGAGGISIIGNPILFIIILCTVVGIEINAKID